MSLSLYKAMFKTHSKALLIYSICVFAYLALVNMAFPMFSDSDELNAIFDSLPDGLLTAFGITGSLSDINDYMAMNFYNSLYLYILMAYTILTAVQLMSKYVDRGSMAYLVSTAVSRSRMCFTQFAILFTGLLAITVAAIVAGLISAAIFAGDSPFDVGVFLQMNAIVFLIFLVVSSYSFLISSALNDEKQAMGLGFGITVVFYAIDLASKLTAHLDWLSYFTLFSLYQPQEIAQGDYPFVPASLFLIGVSIVMVALSVMLFRRRDLPL